MINSKVVLTYKRKRLSSGAHLAHGIRESNSSPESHRGIPSGWLIPEVEPNSYIEKVNEDNVKKGQHSTCTRTHDSEESIQHVHDKKRTRKNKSIEKSETGSLNFCPEEVVSSINLYGDGSLKANPVATNLSLNKTTDKFVMDFSSNASGPSGSTVDISAEKASRFKLTDPDNSTKSTPVFMNSSNGKKKSSGCIEDSTLRAFNGNMLLAREHPKENCNAPLITFRRRAKKKKIMLATSDGRNIKVEETQWLSQGHENSSQHFSLKDRSTRTAVLQDHHSPLQMTNIEKDVTRLKSAPARDIPQTRIASDRSEGSPFLCSQGRNSAHTEEVPEDHPSDQCMEAPSIDAIGDSILMKVNKLSDSAKASIDVNNAEKISVPYSEERYPLDDLNLSAAPPSPPSPRNVVSDEPSMEPNKQSTDVSPENLQHSRSSSTPSFAMVLDEEADERTKELEWLEDLDKSLRGTERSRSKHPFRDEGNANCVQASGGREPPTTSLINPSVQNLYNQVETIGYMNQKNSSRDGIFPSRLGERRSGKQQLGEASNRSLLCTNFLGLSPSPHPEIPFGSVKDFHKIASRSSLSFRETDGMHDGRLSWHSWDEKSSSRIHKQAVEDVGTSTRMLNEIRGYPIDWSEEELDHLWIGVRRHGIYNWNGMLRDPKLCFLESRGAEDLAKQWDLEQRKLFNGTSTQPHSLTKQLLSTSSITNDASLAKSAAGARYGGYGFRPHASMEFPSLSLGDAYLQRESILKRNPFYSVGLNTGNILTGSGSFSVSSTFPTAGIRQQNQTRVQNSRLDWENSTLRQSTGEGSSQERQSAGPPANGNLPHWLKQVLGTPPILAVGYSGNIDPRVSVPLLNLGESPVTPLDARGRGILKRKSLVSDCNTGGFKMSDVTSSTRLGHLPSLGPDENKISDQNIKSLDLVVIDSDVSSEETISDNQNCRL